MGNLKGKAYNREEYRFKKAHPVKWWLMHQVKLFSKWLRKISGRDLYIKDLK